MELVTNLCYKLVDFGELKVEEINLTSTELSVELVELLRELSSKQKNLRDFHCSLTPGNSIDR